MQVIFKNVPKRTNPYRIKEMIMPILEGGLFKDKGLLHDLHLVEISDFADSFVDYHFIAEITPNSAAMRVIKKLNGVRLANITLNVAQYHIRGRKNCRRLKRPFDEQANQQKRDKRVFDRRVKHQVLLISSVIA